MIYKTYIPDYPLSEIVDYFWYVYGTVNHPREKILPAGNQELMINLNDEFLMEDNSGEVSKKCRKMWFSSVLTKPIIIHTSTTKVIGISFKNSGAFSLFGFPLKEFNNIVTDIENIWFDKVNEIRDRLLEFNDINAQFKLLDKLITSQINNYVGLNKSVEYSISLMGNMNIKDISAKVGYTPKHLISLFKQYMGINPNLYKKIIQFQSTLNMMNSNKDIDLQEVAFRSGYYDQSHFIHYFKEFAEFTPTQYLKKKGEFANFIPINDK